MSIYKGNTLIAGGSQITPLLSFVWADHLLSDISWLRADTFSWQAGSVYTAVYSHLTSDISGKTLQSETIGGTTIQFYLADDGHKICPANQESNVSAIYSATGVAWYYILDTVNTRFKLPRTQFGFTGLRDSVGGFVEAGLPNISGAAKTTTLFNNSRGQDGTNGIIKTTQTATIALASGGGQQGLYSMEIDASWGNSIYGNSTTVQPKATQMYLYFYVGQFTQTAISQTAGLNAELFNGKVDKGHQVIEFQAPTADNNYTWYRKYADGWVEQGGVLSANNVYEHTIVYPVAFADTNYYILTTAEKYGVNNVTVSIQPMNSTKTAMGITFRVFYASGTVSEICYWEVKGMSAQ